jgi:Protein of unknown function (DUF3263)
VENYAQVRGASPLGEREQRVLAFERQWWRHAGAKEEAIRREFGVGPTAYYQLLSRLIDDPAATAHDPMLVKRLQRQRASRRRRRSGAVPGEGARSELPQHGTRIEGSTLPAKPTS